MPGMRLSRAIYGERNKALHQTPLHVNRPIVSESSMLRGTMRISPLIQAGPQIGPCAWALGPHIPQPVAAADAACVGRREALGISRG